MMKAGSSLKIAAQLDQLDLVRRFVEEQAIALGLDTAKMYDVLLSVDEITTNIVVHGYCGRPGIIEVEMQPAGHTLLVYVRDHAPPFDPTTFPAPDITLPLETRPVGGMGIHIARGFVDTMSYRALSQGGNELTLVKKGVIGKSPQEGPHAHDG